MQNAQRLRPNRELLQSVRGFGVSVSDELLRGYIRELREALGDDAKKTPGYIETVPTRGYRFLPYGKGTTSPPFKSHLRSSSLREPYRSCGSGSFIP